MTARLIVADAMLRRPTVHSAGLTVTEAREAFDASPKTHLLLLVHDSRLVTSLTREDLDVPASPRGPAARLGSLAGRTIAFDSELERTRQQMVTMGLRRLVVVDARQRMLGLLCLKRSLGGFCTDEGIATMRAVAPR